GGERNRKEYDHRLRHGARVEIEQQENDEHRDRDDDVETPLGALHIFKLSAPDHLVAGRQLNLLSDGLLGVGDVTSDVALRGVEIDVDVTRQPPVLVADHRRAADQLYIGYLSDRYLRAARRHHERARDAVEVAAVI